MSRLKKLFQETPLNLGGQIFELIDMRSFSNLWYWIGLAVLWSTTSHFVMGVPFDLVGRARRKGGQFLIDMNHLAQIKARRLRDVYARAGVWIIGGIAFVLTILAVTGFYYGVEFAQAVFLLVLPMSFVGAMRIRLAYRIEHEDILDEALCRALTRHRFGIQVIGMISVFVTSIWGMYQNMNIGVLG